jgi:SAM-dependent methyltransferase
MNNDPAYDHIAAQYKESKQLDFRKYIELHTLLKLAGNLEGKQVLDLACGEGIYTRKIKSLGAANILGVDISAEMIKLAEEEEAKNPIGCEYRVKDVFDLGQIGSYDIVMGMYLLNYAQTKNELLQMCKTVCNNLSDTGSFIGFNDNPNNRLENYGSYGKYGFIKESTATREEGDFIRYVISNPDGTTFSFNNYYLSPQTYESCFKEAGFTHFQWEGPFMDDKIKGDTHWDEFFLDPPLIGFSARK